jgi:1-acyl-sn-glycerol-3-phosphate acyltransferase
MILWLFRLIKLLIAWIDVALLWIILYPLSFLPRKITTLFYPPLFHFFCKVFGHAMGVELKLHQKNKRALPEHYIVISNHPSCFEDVGMTSLFNARFLAKQEVQHWWLVGRLAKAGEMLFFHRESKEGRHGATEDLLDALNNGENIGLYPEGGCKGRRIHTPFRYGVFDISLQTGVPIIPVFLHYEAQENFEWNKQHLLKKLWQILTSQNKTANYYVFDAIHPTQFQNKEEYCEALQDMYLDWQKKYLE